MRVLLGELRSYILAEVDASMGARAVAGITPVAGPSYEGNRFLAALDPAELAKGQVKVLGTVMFFKQYNEVSLEDGTSVRPYVIDSMFATSPAVAVALMKLMLGACKNVMPSKNVSPAAVRFITSYYARNHANSDLVMPIAGDSSASPPMHCVYRDDGEVNAQAEIKRGSKELERAAKLLGMTVKDLKNQIHNDQFSGFSRAFRSLKSDRPIVKLALSGGEPTIEKIEAAMKTDNYEAAVDYLRRVPDPIPQDVMDWVRDHLDGLPEDELPADVRARYEAS